MFIYRLKTEFSEGRRVVFCLWGMLLLVLACFVGWWHSAIDSDAGSGIGQTIATFAFVIAGLLALGLTAWIFKRDDLKSARAFWATRPIRSLPYFGAKLAFLGLAVVLPVGVLVAVMGLLAGVGAAALWMALESMIWVAAAAGLLALSCMAWEGYVRPLVAIAIFFAGLMAPPVLGAIRPIGAWLRGVLVNPQQFTWNAYALLLVSVVVTVGFCVRQAGDKHRRSRLWMWAVGGFSLLLVAAFVPLPGDLSLVSRDRELEVLPVQTGKVESDVTVNGSGRIHGSNAVSLTSRLELEPAIEGEEFVWLFNELEVHGGGGVAIIAQANSMIRRSENYPDSSDLVLHLWILEGEPTHDRSSSWRESSSLKGKLNALPMRTVRVTGTAEVWVGGYEEIHRGGLDDPYEFRGNGAQYAYLPQSAADGRWHQFERAVVAKRFSMPLISSPMIRNPYQMFRVWVAAPGYESVINRQLEGSGHGNHALLGMDLVKEIRLADDEILQSYEWRQLVQSGYDKSLAEWKKEAQLRIEVRNQERTLRVPIDIEVDIPDPVMVQRMLINGEI